MLDALPEVNAFLNGTATILLVVGYVLIRRGLLAAHKRVMLTAFCVSVAFLASYLLHHYHLGGSKGFPHSGAIRYVYFVILATHVVLAITVPPLALRTIYLGWRDRRAQHRRLARITWPIWLYVSVTGVVIYFMLYQL